MKTKISEFKREYDFLVCIDSDGCAMDTMEAKHRRCFAPQVVEVWQLHKIKEQLLETWYEVNLYSSTRGINRFKGLIMTFEKLANDGYSIPDFESIKKWTLESEELSNPSLIKSIENHGDKQLQMALVWSQRVNQEIKALDNEHKPFPNVIEGIRDIHLSADIAIVSSANGLAVYEEWGRHGLAPYVKVMCGQEAGSKAYCIQQLKEKGKYPANNILMVGDAPSDYDAAKKNGVLYYPIISGKEAQSWKELSKEAFSKFLFGSYKGNFQESLILKFNDSLK